MKMCLSARTSSFHFGLRVLLFAALSLERCERQPNKIKNKKPSSGGNNYNYNSSFGSRHIECEPKSKTCIDAPPVLASFLSPLFRRSSRALSLPLSCWQRSQLSFFVSLRFILYLRFAIQFVFIGFPL